MGGIPDEVLKVVFKKFLLYLGSGVHVHILHPAGLLHRYIHAMVVCCLHPQPHPRRLHQVFLPMLFHPISPVPTVPLLAHHP